MAYKSLLEDISCEDKSLSLSVLVSFLLCAISYLRSDIASCCFWLCQVVAYIVELYFVLSYSMGHYQSDISYVFTV